MKLFRDEKGQTLVLTALLGCCLMGFMALAIDIGVLFRAQRRLQIAADSAAIAGSLADYFSQTVSCGTPPAGTASSSIKCAAANAAAGNGVTDTSQIAVNNPTLNGSHVGGEYIEVVIRQPNPTLFMATFNAMMPGGSANSNSMTVGARAVGGIVPSQLCAYALDKHAKGAVEVQGSASIFTPGCVLQINSDNPQALCTTGGADIVDQAGIRIVGAQNPSGPCNGTQTNASTGANYVEDPFGGLPSPTCTPGTNVVSATTINSSTTLLSNNQTAPSGSIASVTCFDGGGGPVTIANGTTLGTAGGNQIFVFEHGLNMGTSGSGQITINGTVMVSGGNYTQQNTSLTINAPTSGTYNAIAIWVPASNTSVTCDSSIASFKGDNAPGGCLQIQFGSAGTSSLDGMIYAPGAQVYMQDHGGASLVTTIIADEIFDKSSDLTITNYNIVHGATSPLVNVSLVE